MKAIYTKLFSIQCKLKPIIKDSDNPFYHSKYFDINALIASIKPILEEHKLVLIQPLTAIEGKGAIRTILFDIESGESIEDVTPLTYNEEPQKMGSAITYFRRYAIQSLLLLEAEDDDGNSSSKSVSNTASKATAKSTSNSFEHDGYEYVTGISAKTNKPWYARQKVGTKDKDWLQASDFDQAYSNSVAKRATLDEPPF